MTHSDYTRASYAYHKLIGETFPYTVMVGSQGYGLGMREIICVCAMFTEFDALRLLRHLSHELYGSENHRYESIERFLRNEGTSPCYVSSPAFARQFTKLLPSINKKHSAWIWYDESTQWEQDGIDRTTVLFRTGSHGSGKDDPVDQQLIDALFPLYSMAEVARI